METPDNAQAPLFTRRVVYICNKAQTPEDISFLGPTT